MISPVTTFTQSTATAIADNSVTTTTIVVTGLSGKLLDLDLTTFLRHTFPGDLDITLTSPSGTVVTITTDNGGTNDDSFNGTVWNDNSPDTVTDKTYAVGVPVLSLSPEEALAAFIGEDPNGVWTLTISDDTAVDTGTLDSWSLALKTYSIAPVVAVPIPDQNSPEDSAWSFTVDAGAFFDGDGDALAFTATLGDGSALPGWLSFDGPTRTFTGTPPTNFNGALDLKVTASDGISSVSDTFMLTVTPENDPPTAIALSAASIAENSANGTVIGTLSDTDVDAGDTATYTLTDNAGGRFGISGDKLVVADGTLLDYESATSHNVTVRVTDSGGATFDKVFAITVGNVNDAPTAIALSAASIAENSANGTVIGTLSDTDQDAGDTATYTLTDTAGGRFGISGDKLVVADGTLLDYENATSHSVTVRVTDSGGATFDKAFTIDVTDVVEVGPPSATSLYQWAGSGNLGAHGGGYQIAAVGDFNGDGTADVLWRNPTTGALDQWQLQNGNWSKSIDLGSHGAGWTVAATGDFNGDGTDDLIWRESATGKLDAWIMQNGNWSQSVDLGSHGTDWKVLGAGDFNGDGIDDLVFQNTTTGAVDEWVMANGNWSASKSLGTHNSAWSSAAVGDLDGDGTSDVLWFNPTSGAVEAWHMQNGNWAGTVGLGSHNTAYALAAVDDFNGDGTSDVLWRNATTGQVDGWVIDDGNWFASVDLGAFNTAWQLAGTGDVNHAGGADVIWANQATGQVGTWLLAPV